MLQLNTKERKDIQERAENIEKMLNSKLQSKHDRLKEMLEKDNIENNPIQSIDENEKEDKILQNIDDLDKETDKSISENNENLSKKEKKKL